MPLIPFYLKFKRTGNSLCWIPDKIVREAMDLEYLSMLSGLLDTVNKTITITKLGTGSPIVFPAKSIVDERIPIKRRLLEFLKLQAPKHVLKAKAYKKMYQGEQRTSNQEKFDKALEFLCERSFVGSDGAHIWFLSEGLATDLDYDDPAELTKVEAELKTFMETIENEKKT